MNHVGFGPGWWKPPENTIESENTMKRPELSVFPCGLRMKVMARNESLRLNRYQSYPTLVLRGGCSNASAGLKKRRLGIFVGYGPGPSRLRSHGLVVFGS